MIGKDLYPSVTESLCTWIIGQISKISLVSSLVYFLFTGNNQVGRVVDGIERFSEKNN